MPRINQYKDSGGYYIRSKFDDLMVTYQVTEQGKQYLQQQGFSPGSYIEVDKLLWLQKRGYVYTYGSGPGEVDLPPIYYRRSRRKRRKKQSGCCCSSTILFVLLCGFVSIVGPVVIFRHYKALNTKNIKPSD